jgi:hypothetical protein
MRRLSKLDTTEDYCYRNRQKSLQGLAVTLLNGTQEGIERIDG